MNQNITSMWLLVFRALENVTDVFQIPFDPEKDLVLRPVNYIPAVAPAQFLLPVDIANHLDQFKIIAEYSVGGKNFTISSEPAVFNFYEIFPSMLILASIFSKSEKLRIFWRN
jgi:hypothetical protein